MSQSQAEQLIDDTEKIFTQFGMDSDVFPSNFDEAMEIKRKVAIQGAKLLLIRQKHLGSDHLPEYIDAFSEFLEKHGVTLFENTNVQDIVSVENGYDVLYNENQKIHAHKVIVAPGRTGAKWIQELADKYHIPYLSQSIEIGVRVEVRKEFLEAITNIIYDPTIFIRTDTYGDQIRTFCTNPGGFVAKKILWIHLR